MMNRWPHIPARFLTLVIAGAVALAAVAWGGPSALAQGSGGNGAAEPDLRPREVRGLEIENKLGERVPLALTFTQVDGTKVRLGDFFNRASVATGHKKPVVLMMVYYRCPILCPMVLEKFTKTLNQLDFTAGTEYDALVVSFDPRDTPEDAVRERANQLLSYKQPTTQSIRDGWNFLTCTGTPENARSLADAVGFPYRYLMNTGEFAHGAAVFVLTPEGKVSRYLLGLDYPVRDVRLALLDASDGKIGNLIDKFTLWCYHYDPNAGVYSVEANRVMKVGASACAVALGGLVFGLFRWERRKRLRLLDAKSGSAADAAGSVGEVPTVSAIVPGVRGRA